MNYVSSNTKHNCISFKIEIINLTLSHLNILRSTKCNSKTREKVGGYLPHEVGIDFLNFPPPKSSDFGWIWGEAVGGGGKELGHGCSGGRRKEGGRKEEAGMRV